MTFQSANNKLGKTGQLELSGIQFAPTATRVLGEIPTQNHPYIEQKQSQSHQQETVSGIRRGCPTTNLGGATITGFNTEATAIQTTHLARRQIKLNEDENPPSRTSFEPFGAFSRGEDTTNHQVCCSRQLRFSIFEDIPGAISLRSSDQITWTFVNFVGQRCSSIAASNRRR